MTYLSGKRFYYDSNNDHISKNRYFRSVSNAMIYYGLLIMYNVAVNDKLSKSFINKEKHDRCQS